MFTEVLRGIGKAVTHMHQTGILNNNIREENVALRNQNSDSLSPVVLSLSLACRVDSTKPLTIAQQSTYGSCDHLPSRVLKGLEAPSFASDRYSVCFIIADIIKWLPKCQFSLYNNLDSLWRKCYRMDTRITVDEFDTAVMDCYLKMNSV